MLPQNNLDIPFKRYEHLYKKYEEHRAWYQNDVDYLKSLIYTNYSQTPERKFSYYYNESRNSVREYLHVPLADDISNTSSTLLLGDEVKIKIPGSDSITPTTEVKNTQERLEYIIKRGKLHSRLLNASELSSAFGGIYIKIDWDLEMVDTPFFTIVRPDLVLPTFKYGFLKEVTFFKEIDRIKEPNKQEDTIYRLAENRTKGKITYGLYKGTLKNIGYKIPLTFHSETKDIQETVITRIDDLLVRFIPNVLPNRYYCNIPFGRSDYDGIEYLFNALDLTYTAWLREIRLGQARIIIPETWLQRTDPSNGSKFKFDVDREIFTTLDIDPMSGQGATVTQFDLRVEQFKETCLNYMSTAISMAGYSPQTFGLNINGQAESGTALNIKERKSIKTTKEKQTFYKDDLEELYWLLLRVDNDLNNSNNYLEEIPIVEFQETLSFDRNRVADTLMKINQAQAATIKTKVQLLHPDWDDKEINLEVQGIMQEQGIMDIESDEIFSMAEGEDNNIDVEEEQENMEE